MKISLPLDEEINSRQGPLTTRIRFQSLQAEEKTIHVQQELWDDENVDKILAEIEKTRYQNKISEKLI
jgi:hypothetical protein